MSQNIPSQSKFLALLAVLSAIASAQNVPLDLTDLSLDELSNIKVTSFAKKVQKLSNVAGAVYVITQEQIARSGLNSVPELLRLAPGLDVERVNGSQWSIAARGFDGVFATKLLVLVDGRSIYSPIFSGVYWDMGMPALEDIDRIEVIRGPGATIWGANAVLGVINIITKQTSETLGTLLTAAAGNSERAFGSVRFGGTLGSNTFRASFFGADHAQLEQANGSGAGDGSHSEQGSFRLDHSGKKDSWTLAANLFRGTANESGISVSLTGQSALPAPLRLNSLAADVSGEWRRRLTDSTELRLRSYYEYADRPQPQASAVATQTWDNEVQLDFVAAKRHNVSLGAGERLIGSHISSLSPFMFNPPDATYANENVFAQDEIHFLADRLLFTAGAKLEHSGLSGWAAEPSANLVWILNNRHSLWASVARAIRTPSIYERSVNAPLYVVPPSPASGFLPVVVGVLGAPNVGNELVTDYEAGYRAEFTKRLSLDLDFFYDRDSKFRSLVPGAPSLVFSGTPYVSQPFVYSDRLYAIGKGGESALSWQVFRDWKVAGSYTYNALKTWLDASAPSSAIGVSGGKPTHTKVKLQSYWNLSSSVQLDAFVYWTSQADPYSAFAFNIAVPPYWRLDMRLGYRINPHWQVSLSGQNLLQARHLEGVPEVFSLYSDVTRGAYLKSTWQF